MGSKYAPKRVLCFFVKNGANKRIERFLKDYNLGQRNVNLKSKT